MKKLTLFTLLFVLLFSLPVLAQDGAFPRMLVDGLGTEVTISAPPQRIVSVSLGVDETLLPVLGVERFAAVTQLAADPGISNVAVLASQVPNHIVSSADTEQIISLAPDLVFVASFTSPDVIQQLRDAGLTVFATSYAVGFDSVRENMRLLGQVVGEETAIEALIAEMDAQIAATSAVVGEQETPVRALYLTPGNYTSGAKSTISEVIAAAGGVDVTVNTDIDPFAALSDEFIIEQNPDVIFLTGWTPYDPTFIDTFTNNPAFASLSAIQNGRVYVVNDAHMTSVSQYIAEGVKDAAAYLYPELFPTFPVTVTDAAGEDVTIDTLPRSIAVVGEANGEALNALLGHMDDAPFDILIVDLEDGDLGVEGEALFFTTVPSDDLPPMSGAENVTYVTIYDGDIPAEIVANTLIMGEALGERVAALDAVAVYTDEQEAEAAE